MNIADKLAESKIAQDNRRKDQDRLCQIAAEVFASDAGQELLGHICQRFDLLGRTFIASVDRGDVNALRAAIRDGERAAVNYLLSMIRSANPDFKLPL